MKELAFSLLLTIFSSNKPTQQHGLSNSNFPQTVAESEVCWQGNLNGRFPIFVHYSIHDSVVVGEITYLNTKERIPIRLVGTIEKDGGFRLLEFEQSGNITGIIIGLPRGRTFNGTWFSPKTRKEFALSLTKKDTLVKEVQIETSVGDIFGHYHYQYSEAGYQGDLEIKKLQGSKAVFGISSVTGAPGRNIAQVDDDTVDLNKTSFIYSKLEEKDCEFEVKFYKGFAIIRYTRGLCNGYFGMNATVEGIFFKTD